MKKRLSFEQTLIVLSHLKPPILVAYVEKKTKKTSKQTNKRKTVLECSQSLREKDKSSYFQESYIFLIEFNVFS